VKNRKNGFFEKEKQKMIKIQITANDAV